MSTTLLHQSSAMGLAIDVVAVFLACLAAGNAVPAHFPHGKTVVYKYYGEAKAGTIEPAAYASQFALEGTLHVKHDTSDPTLRNAYYVVLSNVKTGMHNGVAAHYQRTKVLTPIIDAAKVIEKPFLIVYDDNGKLQGVKIPATEVAWSRNMKMAMASMLQLDLENMRVDEAASRPRSFVSKENTIHGDCWITYDVHPKDRIHPSDGEIVVTKFSSPKNCSGFVVNLFDHVDDEGCQADTESPVNVASRRLFEIEKQGEDILIKKLVAHGGSNYFPWNTRSEAHYVLTNTTFALEKVVPVAEIGLPPMNFLDVPMTRDLTYRKPEGNYAVDAAVDVTQGRRVVDLERTVTKLKKMLGEAADYLEENHLEPREPDWKHGQTINRILHTMSYMDVGSLEEVFDAYRGSDAPKDVTIENIFLGMVPQVGTTASCLFALNAVREHKIGDVTAIEMLAKLPLNVKLPSERLIVQMEDLFKFGDSTPVEVRKAGILCFASLVYRTFKNVPNPRDSPLLRGYLRHFLDHLENEPSYEMKIVYLMALKNVQVGKVHELLAPIVRGDSAVSENPVNIRLLAIWAINKPLGGDYRYAHDLLWPIMADESLPVKLRIAAYEILMHRAPTMSDVLRMYWFMVYESNEHLYNYHHTTIKGIANSVDPCKVHLRELVRKIMRFTRVHETVRYTLSSAYSIDYKDEMYNHAERLDTGMILDEVTGVPEVLQFEHIVTDARKPVSNVAVRLHIRGHDGIRSLLNLGQTLSSGGLSNPNVLEILRKAAKDMPAPKNLLVDVVLMHKGRVVLANHYNEQTWRKLCDDVVNQAVAMRIVQTDRTASNKRWNANAQHIIYDDLYEKQVTSDMGLPVLLETRIPLLASLKINCDTAPDKTNLEFDGKIWRHGDYSMSIYNPMADVWHAVRRSTATDVGIPIHASISYNKETKNAKVSFPRLPATNLAVAGVLTHAKDCVTVNEDDVEALKKSCATCHHREDVSLGTLRKKYYQSNIDSKDTGLQYSMSIFDCESGVTPVTLSAEWYRALMSKRKNDWNDWIVHAAMATRQQLKNMIISPQMGSCGSLLKIEPSIVHPTSRVDLSVRTSYEDVDHINPSFHLFGSQKYNVRGTVDLIAASTNTSARSWDLNVNVDVDQGHLMNIAKIQLTRKTPGETNLKICVDAQKSYSPAPTDPLKLGVTKEETNTKLTVAVGRTNEEKCVRDDTLITTTVKGELSNEQKKQFSQEIANGACSVDTKNSLYANPKNIVPKTLNCLNEVVRHTTLRKYTINVTHRKVPQDVTSKILNFEDILRSHLLPNLKYTIDHVETGNIKISAEYPVQKDVVDVSVVTPTRSYDLIDVDLEKPRFNGFGPVVKPVWHLPLDNTRFDVFALRQYTHDELKMCSIYPEIVLTGDGKNIPFNITEQWTLISGDHANKAFAVFAKIVGKNMAVKVYAEDHRVEIVPSADNSVRMMVDGQAVGQLEGGVLVPNDVKTWILKVTKNNDHILVQMKGVPLIVVHGINHVALAINTQLQGKVSGLCGHLDGTYLTEIPKLYTTPNL